MDGSDACQQGLIAVIRPVILASTTHALSPAIVAADAHLQYRARDAHRVLPAHLLDPGVARSAALGDTQCSAHRRPPLAAVHQAHRLQFELLRVSGMHLLVCHFSTPCQYCQQELRTTL